MEVIRLKNVQLLGKFNEYSAYVLKAGYLYDQENKEAVIASLDILNKNETGLIIIGNPGSGKTLLFEIVQKITNPQSESAFIKLNVLDVVLDFNNKNVGHAVFQKWKSKNIFFDDLGTEGIGHLYGEKVEVFEKFIQIRYDLFRSHKLKTHFTSNLSYQQLNERYGMRCMSRLNEMCKVVMLGQNANYKDRREYRNFLGLPSVYHPPIMSKEDVEWYKNYNDYKKQCQENPQPASSYEGLGSRFKKEFGI